MNVANLLNRTINPFEKPNIPNINQDQHNVIKNLLINTQTNQSNVNNNPNSNNLNISNAQIKNNLNLSNILPFITNSGLSPQDILNYVKNNNLSNINNQKSDQDIHNEKKETSLNLDKNKIVLNKNLNNNSNDRNNDTNKFKISPINSNNVSEGEEDSSEKERFFMVDKNVEKIEQSEKTNYNTQSQFNFDNQNIPNVNNVNLEELIKNANNNPNLLNILMNNDNLRNALNRIKEKGESQNLFLSSSLGQVNLKTENQNNNEKIDSRSYIKNQSINEKQTSILKDLGDDKPKDPRRKKKDSK